MNSLEEDEPMELFQGIASLKTRILFYTVLQIEKDPSAVTVEKEKKKKSWCKIVMFMCRSSEARSEFKIPCFLEASVYSGRIQYLGPASPTNVGCNPLQRE